MSKKVSGVLCYSLADSGANTFVRCTIVDADVGLDASKKIFRKCTFVHCKIHNFTQAEFSQCTFVGCTFDCKLSYCQLKELTFVKCKILRLDALDCEVKFPKFSKCDIKRLSTTHWCNPIYRNYGYDSCVLSFDDSRLSELITEVHPISRMTCNVVIYETSKGYYVDGNVNLSDYLQDISGVDKSVPAPLLMALSESLKMNLALSIKPKSVEHAVNLISAMAMFGDVVTVNARNEVTTGSLEYYKTAPIARIEINAPGYAARNDIFAKCETIVYMATD